MLKKSPSVMWVLADEGIVLNNQASGFFIELGPLQERVWAYCDGSCEIEDIIRVLKSNHMPSDEKSFDIEIRNCLNLLLTNGFLYEENVGQLYEQRKKDLV